MSVPDVLSALTPIRFRSAFGDRLLLTGLIGFAVLSVMAASSPLHAVLDGFLHDDSFYYLTIARNIAAGAGSTFDGVNYTNGYQPGWLVILVGLYAMPIPPDQMVVVAMLVQASLFAAGLVVLSIAIRSRGLDQSAAAAAIAVVFVGAAPILAWDVLEAGLTVLTSGLLFLALMRGDVTPVWIGGALSLAILSRTDHVFMAPAILLWVWLQRREVRDRLWSSFAFVCPIALIVGAYLAWNLVTTGHLVPVSGRVKMLEAQHLPPSTFADLISFDIRQSWKLGFVAGAIVVINNVIRRRFDALAAYALGGIAMCVYYHVTFGRAYASSFWYYVPLYIVLAHSVAWCFDAVMKKTRTRQMVVAGLVFAVIGAIALRGAAIYRYRQRPPGDRANIYLVAQHLKAIRTPGARAAAWDAGILGYYGGGVTNLDGLVNSADYMERYLALGRTADYVREHGFRYVVCYESDTRPGGRAEALLRDYRSVSSERGWLILERNQR